MRGFCTDKSNLELFDNVNVYGDITNCNIHHMWYGMYSYGHQGGVWTDNIVHGEDGCVEEGSGAQGGTGGGKEGSTGGAGGGKEGSTWGGEVGGKYGQIKKSRYC